MEPAKNCITDHLSALSTSLGSSPRTGGRRGGTSSGEAGQESGEQDGPCSSPIDARKARWPSVTEGMERKGGQGETRKCSVQDSVMDELRGWWSRRKRKGTRTTLNN